jgi:hypothetical protein
MYILTFKQYGRIPFNKGGKKPKSVDEVINNKDEPKTAMTALTPELSTPQDNPVGGLINKAKTQQNIKLLKPTNHKLEKFITFKIKK